MAIYYLVQVIKRILDKRAEPPYLRARSTTEPAAEPDRPEGER